jgi:hypothetical protein
LKQIRKRLTYANVMSSLAVFLVIGGATAFAATQLPKNSVGSKQLKKNAVTTAKIKKEAVAGGKIKNGAVSESKLADGAVTTNKIGDNAVTTPKIIDNAVTSSKVANGSITGEKLATQYLPASTQGVPLAGANVSATGVVRAWFNRFGGEPTVNKVAAGDYRLTFPGLQGQSYFSTSLSTATLVANPGEISLSSASGNPIVNTFNSTGTATDHEFDLTLIFPGVEP